MGISTDDEKMEVSSIEDMSPLASVLLSAIERQDADALRAALSEQDAPTLRRLLAERTLLRGTRWPTSVLHYAASHGRHDAATAPRNSDFRGSRTSVSSSISAVDNNNGSKTPGTGTNGEDTNGETGTLRRSQGSDSGSGAGLTTMSAATALVASILEHGIVGVNAVDERGNTPLWDACYYGRMRMVRYLIGRGADVNAQSKNGSSALHVAAQRGYTLVTAVLLDRGAKVNATKDDGTTPLMAAAENGHSRIVSLLSKHGVDVTARDRYGMTALHVAAAWGRCATIEALVTIGADLDAQDDDEDTPLHSAMNQGHYDACCLLVYKGARADIANSRGELPMNERNVAVVKRYHQTQSGTSIKSSTETTV